MTAKWTNAVMHQIAGDMYGIIKEDGTRIDCVMLPERLEDLLFLHDDHRIDVLWVMPGSGFSKRIEQDDFRSIDRERYNVYTSDYDREGRKPSFGRVRRQEQGAYNLHISFPEHQEWKSARDGDKGRWAAPSAATLLRTVVYLKRELDVNIVWSPATIGMDIMRGMHRDEVILPFPESWGYRWDAIDRQMADWNFWSKILWDGYKLLPGLSEDDRKKKYIVGLDKNGQFVGASSSALLGSGEPIEVDAASYKPEVPGFWHYTITGIDNTRFNGRDLPCPLSRDDGYASTELIRAALHVGVELKIHDGIMWEKGKKYLARWAKDMWDHRVNLSNEKRYTDPIARRNAQGSAKKMANGVIGKFRAVGRDNRPISREYYHPDWQRGIVHQATASQTFTLNRLQRDFNVLPVLVSKDAFYVLTDEEDMAKVAPGLLDHQNELRGFKLIGHAKLTSDIVDVFFKAWERETRVDGIETYIKRCMGGSNA